MSKLAIVFLMIVAPALAICLALLGLETLGTNLLGWFLLLFGIAYPAGAVIYYFIRREPFWKSASGEVLSEEKGDRSFWTVLPGFLVVFYAPPVEWLILPHLLPRLTWMQITGLVLILAAMALLIWARSHIRGLYTGHVEIHSGHRLVETGPYRLIRHPGYAAFMLLSLGIAFGYSSLIGLIAVPLLLLPGLLYRMTVEEKLLVEQFGEEYTAYQQRTRKFIPGIW